MINLPGFDLERYMQSIIGFFTTSHPDLLIWAKNAIGVIIGASIPVSVFLFIGILYSAERLSLIRRKEEEIYNKPKESKAAKTNTGQGNPEMARRWNKVMNHVEASSENDWRQAIIEADIILGDLLTKLGYRGQTIGEQLQRVVKGDFKTRDEAWEAHKIRNEIAHSGTEFQLSQFEARRVVSLYRKVFEEFFHI